jgi:hypothetical protein
LLPSLPFSGIENKKRWMEKKLGDPKKNRERGLKIKIDG